MSGESALAIDAAATTMATAKRRQSRASIEAAPDYTLMPAAAASQHNQTDCI